jgi:glutaconate CoA-transferase subunit A
MTHKLVTLADAVRRFSHDGMLYSSGAALPIGADAVVFGRELVRAGRRGVHAAFHCNSQQLNLLCASGVTDRVECGFSGLEGFGFANGLRRAVESGRVVLEDYSNLSMALRLLAGALNWPFAPSTTNIGSGLQQWSAFAPDESPSRSKIPEVVDPFTGKAYGALAPLRPDVAVIHVTLADAEGNAIMLGTEWSRFELSRAARRVVLIADHIVDTACMRQYPNLVRIPGVIVDAVVYWPFSAWPQASPGVHDCDEAHMRLMNEALGTEEGTARYRREFIDAYRTRAEYRAMIGAGTLERLGRSRTAFLLDPYRRWIVDDAEIEALER